MVDVTVTRRYKGVQTKQVGSVYNYSVNTGSAVPVPPGNSPPGDVIVPYPDPAIYEFSDTDTPTITDFDILYVPTYGRHPRFTLIIYENALESEDSEDERVQYMPPLLTVVNDVITTVTYDLSGLGAVSGKIIINK